MIRMNPRPLQMRTMARACVAVLVLGLNSTLAFAAEDPVAGQRDFAVRCASCHGTTAGEKKTGPTLAGVFGQASGNGVRRMFVGLVQAGDPQLFQGTRQGLHLVVVQAVRQRRQLDLCHGSYRAVRSHRRQCNAIAHVW